MRKIKIDFESLPTFANPKELRKEIDRQILKTASITSALTFFNILIFALSIYFVWVYKDRVSVTIPLVIAGICLLKIIGDYTTQLIRSVTIIAGLSLTETFNKDKYKEPGERPKPPNMKDAI